MSVKPTANDVRKCYTSEDCKATVASRAIMENPEYACFPLTILGKKIDAYQRCVKQIEVKGSSQCPVGYNLLQKCTQIKTDWLGRSFCVAWKESCVRSEESLQQEILAWSISQRI